MADMGRLAAVRITAGKAKNRHRDEAKNDGKEHHRRREPEYLSVPSPAEIKGPIAEGCSPHYRYEDRERRENEAHSLSLTSDEAFSVHPAIMPPGGKVCNWALTAVSFLPIRQ